MAAARPSAIWSVLICEHEDCGEWMVVRRGDLPTCRKCKRGDRRWRLATPQEIAAQDQQLLRELRIAADVPDRHLGAKE